MNTVQKVPHGSWRHHKPPPEGCSGHDHYPAGLQIPALLYTLLTCGRVLVTNTLAPQNSQQFNSNHSKNLIKGFASLKKDWKAATGQLEMSEISSLAMLDVKPLLLPQCQGPKGQGAGAAAPPSPGHKCCGLSVCISAAEVASHVAFKVPQPKGCPLLPLQYGHS